MGAKRPGYPTSLQAKTTFLLEYKQKRSLAAPLCGGLPPLQPDDFRHGPAPAAGHTGSVSSSANAGQICSFASCDQPAAFRARTKPAWCDRHITTILGQGGLEPLEPFVSPKAFRFTRCTSCACEAHYRLEYTLTKNAEGEATCRACFWRAWAARTRAMQGAHADWAPTSPTAAEALADAHDYDYLGALSEPSLPDDPHLVRCRFCGRQSAERLADVAWAASARSTPLARSRRRTHPPATPPVHPPLKTRSNPCR